MSLSITFVTHATSLDNEAGVASGHFDVELSPLGIEQAAERAEHLRDETLAAVSSDLRRAAETARIAFGDRGIPLEQDRRLRECDYGELTRASRAEVAAARPGYIERPFPGGESYRQVAARMREALDEFAARHEGERIAIVGHRATQDCLEHLANGVPLAETISLPWEWQPGWRYEYAVTVERR
jgi:broad specificity phosphatase PhoE